MRDIVDYDFSATLAVLQHAADNRGFWVRSCWRVQQNAIENGAPTHAFVVPARQDDVDALYDLLETLQFGGVELDQAGADFVAGGVQFRTGDFVIWCVQPYAGFAQALLLKTPYPRITLADGSLRRPYDASEHHLPSYLGVQAWPVERDFEAATRRVDAIMRPAGGVAVSPGGRHILSGATPSAYSALNQLLRRGVKCFWPPRLPWAGGFVVEATKDLAVVRETAQTTGVRFEAIDDLPLAADVGRSASAAALLYELRMPRLGVYQSWVASIDEGWTRWVLEQCGLEFVTLHDADIRAGGLRQRLDAIVLPDQNPQHIIDGHSAQIMPAPYAGGIGNTGVQSLKEFVGQGGTLLVINRACALVIEKFSLPVNIGRECRKSVPQNQELVGQSHFAADSAMREFSGVGAVLRVVADTLHPLAYGARRQEAVFFFESPVFCLSGGMGILSYSADEVVSATLHEVSAQRHYALVEVLMGRGRVVLFGFRPLFRGQFRATYKFFFNAIFYAAAQAVSAWPRTPSQ